MYDNYPRPSFVRNERECLNGEWEFDFDDGRQGLTERWFEGRLRDRITVPFPYQCDLSGHCDKGIHEIVWYSRLFNIPEPWVGRDILLNFGAVDYEASVWVNGSEVGHNRGGHVPFSYDIAPYVKPGSNRVTVRVRDSQDPYQPRGKQSTTGLPRHIDYYCTTGIWQSVWIEPVPSIRIDNLRMTTTAATGTVRLDVLLHAPARRRTLELDVIDNGVTVATSRLQTTLSNVEIEVVIPNPKLWSAESPHLYDLKVRLIEGGKVLDEVASYCGLRSVELENGWMTINGKPTYLAMVLDQGYWPESYLAAPTPDALRADVEWVKKLGFNAVRKHQKIEDPVWLYWCDKLGLMVWCEMPNARAWSSEAEEHLLAEWERAVMRDRNNPCVVAWVPVNESMGFPGLRKSHPGQYAFLERMVAFTRRLDAKRPVIDNDGWEHTDITDICAIHDYSPSSERLLERYKDKLAGGDLPANAWDIEKPMFIRGSKYRGQPIMLTEVGGFLMARPDLPKEQWDLLYAAYGTTISSEDMLVRFVDLMNGIRQLPFVTGFCYTQLTDIEQEMNGLLTYDRREKVPPAAIAKAVTELIEARTAEARDISSS
ncbi:MAG TPA: glycoside hydrolase family 2 TIM barrel-domain containing protein [Capsulimonadaceae bacterium]|jgi:beta-galactosidase/beta-glucuronidase